jgi:hypothetical protein
MKHFARYLLILFSAGFASCDFVGDSIEGNGRIKTETRTVEDFDGVKVSGNIDLHISLAPAHSVRLETDENFLEHIETSTRGGILEIRTRDHVNLRSSRKINVFVSAPEVSLLHASGACRVVGDNRIIAKEAMDIELSGASQITLDINSPRLSAVVSGASSARLSGEIKDLKFDGSGASEVRAYNLLAENVDVRLSGASNAEVYASGTLKADLSGASNVRYSGNAAVVQHTSGASSVRKKD